jgi:hypothetical protein
MKVKDVIERVKAIELASGDCEIAHSMEDSLWGDVLQAIAQGAPHGDLLAEAVLATRNIEFPRYCA